MSDRARTAPDPLEIAAGLRLPAGFRFRAATPDDFAAIAELRNACRRAQGEPATHSEEETRNLWGEPGCDVETDCMLVEDGDGRVVGYEEVYDRGAGRIFEFEAGELHPDARGRGIEDALLRWAERRTESLATEAPEGKQVRLETTKVMPGSESAAEMLKRHGYEQIREFLRMTRDLPERPADPGVPAGLVVRGLRPGDPADARRMWLAMRDAFADHWGVLPMDPGDAVARLEHHMKDPAFDPGLWWAAFDGDEIAGVCFCWKTFLGNPEGSVLSHLGVRTPWRRRGLGRALLRHAFAELKRRGWKHVGLGVDALNGSGAVALYESEGMKTVRRFLTFGRILREGDES